MLKMFTELELLVKETTCRVSRREVGAGIVEYLLLVVFIALVLIVSLLFFSGQLSAGFSRAGNSIPR